MKTLPTRNPAFGFWGTVAAGNGNDEIRTQAMWEMAFSIVASQTDLPRGADAVDVRNFLDSRAGRALADQLQTGKNVREALEAMCRNWARTFRLIMQDRAAFEE